MASIDVDSDQNTRIMKLEERVNETENNVAAIMAKLATLENLAKALMIMVGAAIGIDVVPMMGEQ